MKFKKVISAILVVSTLAIAATSCSKDSSEDAQATETTAEASEEPTETAIEEPKKDENIINLGETVVSESAEFTVNKVEFSDDIAPEEGSNYSTHLTPDEGSTFIYIENETKNTTKSVASSFNLMSLKIVYDDGYEYPVIELSQVYSVSSLISPLETKAVRYYATCPEEVKTSGKPVKLIIDIDNTKYEYDLVK